MGIRIPEKNVVISGECIQCMQCLSICPKESLSASPAGAIAGTAAAAAISGTVIVGNLISLPVTETISNQRVMEKKEKGNYKDGVFTGVGEGFWGAIEVQVTVEDGYITDITILSFRDDQEFFHKAQSAVINAILTEQTPDVSTVSGAAFSSSSIMDAVADALGSSFGSSEQSVDESNDASGQPADSGQESDSVSGWFSVADGTYVGSGNGFRGATSVSRHSRKRSNYGYYNQFLCGRWGIFYLCTGYSHQRNYQYPVSGCAGGQRSYIFQQQHYGGRSGCVGSQF